MAGRHVTSLGELSLINRTGTVVGVQAWSETHVQGTSSGGGGYVGPQGGHVSAPKVSISSSVSDKLHLFVQEEDGSEFDVRLTDAGVGVREGHQLTFIYGGTDAETSSEVMGRAGRILALVNGNTKQSRIYDNRIKDLVRAPGATRDFLKGLFGLAMVGVMTVVYWKLSVSIVELGDLPDILLRSLLCFALGAATVILIASRFATKEPTLDDRVREAVADAVQATINRST